MIGLDPDVIVTIVPDGSFLFTDLVCGWRRWTLNSGKTIDSGVGVPFCHNEKYDLAGNSPYTEGSR